MAENEQIEQELCSIIDEMAASIQSARATISRIAADSPDTRDGISLLSAKNQMMLAYIHSLTLLVAQRVSGYSLSTHSPPTQPFTSTERDLRGEGAGDMVDVMVEYRLVVEKIKTLETRMKYQIEKLVRLAEQGSRPSGTVADDPLAFRPNPEELLADEDDEGNGGKLDEEQVYRPPKLAPVPYTDGKKTKKSSGPIPATLRSLQYVDSSAPYAEKSTGLGVTTSLASARARELQRMTEFEEDNMTRLVMNKKESKRRRMDEADIALGGVGSSGNRRHRGGLQDEFRDILQSTSRTSRSSLGDGYDELRQNAKRKSVLERSRSRDVNSQVDDAPRKRAKFDTALKKMRKQSFKRQ